VPSEAEADANVPLLADLLAIPTTDRYPALTMGPELRKVRTLRALADQLFVLARRGPVLVLLEDAHWIDPTTRELIEAVIEPIGQRRVMLLVTCRPEFQNPWGSHSHVTTLTLNRLGRQQCADLIGQVAGGRQVPETITRAIIDRADGVPLFVEELTKAVLESGLLRETHGELVAGGPLPPLAIPTTLQGSLLARLDRLSTTREVAQIGAAIGREFGYELLAAVAGRLEAELQAALSQLEAAGLVFRRGNPPEAVYSFKHALVQDAAHDSLLKSRRQQLHARIAAAIEQHDPDTASAQPQLLAQHYAEAGFAERSARAWLAAGRLAASRSASQEAAMQFARGIDVLRGMEPGSERDRLELDLQVGRGSACAAAFGHPVAETEKAWRRAIALLRDHPGDPRNYWARRGLSAALSAQGNTGPANPRFVHASLLWRPEPVAVRSAVYQPRKDDREGQRAGPVLGNGGDGLRGGLLFPCRDQGRRGGARHPYADCRATDHRQAGQRIRDTGGRAGDQSGRSGDPARAG